MKFHFGAIIIIFVSILGIILFTLTPVISGKDSIYFDANNWTNTRIIAFGFGNGRQDSEGEILGFPFDNSVNLDINDWSEAFPIYVPILVMIGLAFSIIAGVLFLVADIKTTKNIAILLGILGGACALAGIMSFLQWGQWFLSSADIGFYNVGFFGVVIASAAVLFLSVVYVFNKSKGKKGVVF